MTAITQDAVQAPTEHRHLGYLTAPEISTRLRPESVLCLPIGSYEQHGPHLPVGTDTILAEQFARRAVARWGNAYDAWLLPAIPYGLSREHAWSAGTLSLPVETFTALVLAMCEQYTVGTPARNLLIVNGHGGNRGILEALVYELGHRFALNACVTHPTALSKVRSGSPLPEVHGGMSETSVMLALSPSDVYLERLPVGYAPELATGEAVRELILDRGVTWPWSSADPGIASNGIIGDARHADPDLGQRIVESAVEAYGGVLARLTAHIREP